MEDVNTIDMTPRTKKKLITESMGTKAAADTLGIVVPEEFICPITNEVMLRPLMTKTGQNFERSAIVAWLQIGNGENPITDDALSPSDLIPNRALEEKIAFWRWENLLPDPKEKHDHNVGSMSPTKKSTGATPANMYDSMSDVTEAAANRIIVDKTDAIIGIVSPRKKKVEKAFLRRLAARMVHDKMHKKHDQPHDATIADTPTQRRRSSTKSNANNHNGDGGSNMPDVPTL